MSEERLLEAECVVDEDLAEGVGEVLLRTVWEKMVGVSLRVIRVVA